MRVNDNKSLMINGTRIYDRFKLAIYDLNKKTIDEVGLKQSAIFDANNNLIKVDKINNALEITLIKVEGYSTQSIDLIKRDLLHICQYQEVSNIMIDGYVYYCTITNISEVILNSNAVGLVLAIQLVSPFKYSVPTVRPVRVINQTKEIEILNKGITDIYLDVEVVANTQSDLRITNQSQKFVEVKNISNKCKLLGSNCEIVDVNYSDVEGEINETLMLRHGTNRFTITSSGDVSINFLSQEEYGI